MDIAQAAEKLAQNNNLGTLRARLGKLTRDPEEQAQVLLVAARDHGLNSNFAFAHTLLSRMKSAPDPDAVSALLVLGHTAEKLTTATWWLDESNLHNPFLNLSVLVRRLGPKGDVLLEGLERMDPFTRCVVEISLCAEGVLTTEHISEPSLNAFLGLLLTMSFSEVLTPLGEAIWGERLFVVLAEHVPSLPWRTLADPERFELVWDTISVQAAAQILCRGYWSTLVTALALLERRADPEALRAELTSCAEQWLALYASSAARYGGLGNLVSFLGLVRTGGVDARFYELLNIVTYGPKDRPLLREAILALPPEEREERALRHPNKVDFLYAPHAPTDAVIARQIQQVLNWKRNASDLAVYEAPKVFAAWGVAAAPALIAALDGSRAPFTTLLLNALKALGLPSAAATFDRYLDHKQTREAAADGLAALGADTALPLIEASLTARKKDRRIGAALALSRMPDSPHRRDLAAACLAKERTAEVIALLQPLSG